MAINLLSARQVALLGDIGDPDVDVWGRPAPRDTWVYRRRRAPNAPIEIVTVQAVILIRYGYTERTDPVASTTKYPLRLTDAGRAYLEALT